MKLKDQIHQTTLITKDGSLETSLRDKTNIEDTFHENLQTFEAKVTRAKKEGKEWVETSKEILDYFFPEGTGALGYGHYKDVKVCEFGKSESIQHELDVPLYQRQFGGKEGHIET